MEVVLGDCEMKKLILNLKKEWYDQIASGEKTVEYRKLSSYWEGRLCEPQPRHGFWACGRPFRDFDVVEFRHGYTKTGAIVRNFVKIDVGPCPYEGWDCLYYRIHFDGVDRVASGAAQARKAMI